MSNKNLILLILPFFIASFAEAQSVKVKKEKSRVKGESMEGFEVDLEGMLTEVNASFVKYLKSLGKAKQSSELIILTESGINGNSPASPVYAVTKDNGKTSTAWIGLNEQEWSKDDVDKAKKELEKIIYDFGVKFYRDKIQVQIDESNQAVQAVEKQQQKLVNENKSLNTKLESNKRGKIQLEKSLETNKLEHENLLKKIDQNKIAQDSVAVAGEQIKKVAEMHKDRQKKVN